MYIYKAIITNVIDGDTYDVEIYFRVQSRY